MSAYDAARPSAYVPVPVHAANTPLLDRVTRFVEQNQLASMAGAFALGVVLGVLARR